MCFTNTLINNLNFCFFYIFSTIKLPGVTKQIEANKSSKKTKKKVKEEVTFHVREEDKGKTSDEKKEEAAGEKPKVFSISSRGGKTPRGRRSSRNSSMAAIQQMKAGNIQIGTHPAVVLCAHLVVYSGPASDKRGTAIYKSDADMKSDVKTDVKSDVTSDDSSVLPERCMVPSSCYPYKCLQTAKRGHVKTPMTRLNTPCELSNLKNPDVSKVHEETQEQKYVTNIIVPDAEIETSDTGYDDWLATQGLLKSRLKSSPAKEVHAQNLAGQTSLNNLLWSLDVMYKFIIQNDFSVVDRGEVEDKLQQIIHVLRSKEKVEGNESVIRKTSEESLDGKKTIDVTVEKKKDKCEKVENNKEEKKERMRIRKRRKKKWRFIKQKKEPNRLFCGQERRTKEG